jgi:lambda family phage portal protein
MALADRLKSAVGWLLRPGVEAALKQSAPPLRRQYIGAAVGNLTRITAPNVSADKSIDANIRDLVKNSRDLARNNGYAKRFLRMARNNIAGPRGVAVRPVNAFANGRPYDTLNDAIIAAFREWSRPKYASASGKMSWLQIQRLLVSEWVTTGDGCLQIVYDPENPFGITLQPFDADRLDRDFNRLPQDGQNEVRHGVEINRYGKPLFYHVLQVHPSEIGWGRSNAQFRDKIPADQIIHLYTQDERVDVTRGAPHFAVAMRDMSHIGDAQDASLIALKANALNPAFIETDAAGEVEDPPEGEVLQLSGEAGDVPYLGRGQHVNTLDPNVPQDNYPEFTKAVLRSIAVGLGTSYVKLAGDWSDTSFSSSRMAHADDNDEWIAAQEHFIEIVVRRVVEAWLMSAMLKGKIPANGYDIAKINRIAYQGRRWVSPKPAEDVEVYERRIALGLDSRSEIAASEGRDLWETWEKLKEEQDYAKDQQLNVEPPRKAVPQTPAEAERPAADGEPMADEQDQQKPARGLLRLRGA